MFVSLSDIYSEGTFTEIRGLKWGSATPRWSVEVLEVGREILWLIRLFTDMNSDTEV